MFLGLSPLYSKATLKKNIVSGPAAGRYITAEWELFFFILPTKKLLVKISSLS